MLAQCRRCKLLEDEAAAVHSLTLDKYPEAQREVLMQLLQELRPIQEDVLFQADMTECIQSAAKHSRFGGPMAGLMSHVAD